jgi:hypothetical protein
VVLDQLGRLRERRTIRSSLRCSFIPIVVLAALSLQEAAADPKEVPGCNESTVWLSTLKPGWSWQRNIRPNVPFESCPLHHREYVIAGRVRYVDEICNLFD